MRRAITIATIGLVSALGVALLQVNPLFRLIGLKLYDLQFLLRGARPASEVVLVVLDRASLDRFKEPLIFWHPYYAEAIRAAARGGARIFALDINFAIPVDRWEKDDDRILLEAVIETAPRMPVICGFLPELVDQRQRSIPLYLYASAVGTLATMRLWRDPDAFVRGTRLFETADDPAGSVVPSLALRVAEKRTGLDAKALTRQLAMRPDGTLHIDFAGPPRTFPRVSLADFLDAARAGNDAQLRAWVGGKIVLLGPEATALADWHPTPFYTSGPTSGAEIHANIVETLVNRTAPADAPGWAVVLSAVLAGLSGAACGFLLRPRSAFAAALGIAALMLAATHAAFRAGVLFSALPLVASVVMAALIGQFWRPGAPPPPVPARVCGFRGPPRRRDSGAKRRDPSRTAPRHDSVLRCSRLHRLE